MLNKRPLNHIGQVHGYWEAYHPNGNLWYRGKYLNGQRHGYCETYYDNGTIAKQQFYAR